MIPYPRVPHLHCSKEFPHLRVGANIIMKGIACPQTGTIVAVRDDLHIHGALLVRWNPVGGTYETWASAFGVELYP